MADKKSQTSHKKTNLEIKGSKVYSNFEELRAQHLEQLKKVKEEDAKIDEDMADIKAEADEEDRKAEVLNRELILAKLNANVTHKVNDDYKTICASNQERFHLLCKDLPSPDLFIDYDFLFMVAACLARKVWWGTNNSYIGNLYPNLYLVFVTPPGIGKSLPANTAGRILGSLVEFIFNQETQKYQPKPLLNMGPDCITFEKLLIRAASYNEVTPWVNGPMKYYHHSSSTFCLGDEMGMLFTEQTKRVISFLMKAWDCGDFEGDFVGRGTVKIKNICLNFLGCTTPLIMKDLMRTRVLDSGFTGRALFIYADKKRQKIRGDLTINEEQINETKILATHLRKLCKLSPTSVICSPEAKAWFSNWVDTKEDIRINQNPRLEDYYSRRAAQLKKLAICIHYANNFDNIITVQDFIQAELILLRTEPLMHKALVQAGENPIYLIGEEMKNYLRIHKEIEKRKLVLDFFSMGSHAQIQTALTYLMETNQIKAYKNSENKLIISYIFG